MRSRRRSAVDSYHAARRQEALLDDLLDGFVKMVLDSVRRQILPRRRIRIVRIPRPPSPPQRSYGEVIDVPYREIKS